MKVGKGIVNKYKKRFFQATEVKKMRLAFTLIA